MTISEVKTSNDQKEFIRVATIIYKNESKWIRPLNKDIQSVFNPKKNKSFRKGEVIRWILKKDDKLIGRIAAFFINSNKVEKNNYTDNIESYISYKRNFNYKIYF